MDALPAPRGIARTERLNKGMKWPLNHFWMMRSLTGAPRSACDFDEAEIIAESKQFAHRHSQRHVSALSPVQHPKNST